MKRVAFLGSLFMLLSFLSLSAQASTIITADVKPAKLHLPGIYKRVDNNLASGYDPVTSYQVFGNYGVNDRWEVLGLISSNQYDRVITGQSISGNPPSYGIGAKYFVNKDDAKRPDDVALSLMYGISSFSTDITGAGKADWSWNELSTEVLLSKTYMLESWPYVITPYGGISITTLSMTASGAIVGSITESLKSFDIGARVPVAKEWDIFAEYNAVIGYTNTNNFAVAGGALFSASLASKPPFSADGVILVGGTYHFQ